MNVFKISKKNGKFRTIYVPDSEEKESLRNRLPELNKKAQELNNGAQHGFQIGRSPVTNALQHVGFKYTLSFDLQDFFDTVKPEMVPPYLMSPYAIKDCFPDGAARQGLPTSPVLANIAASPMDKEIMELMERPKEKVVRLFRFFNFVYTRYADDLTFSFDDFETADYLKTRIPQIVDEHGFKINKSKTKLQWSGAGRRIITGVAVDDKGIFAPREIKRRIRAAMHQGRSAELRGLREWAKLKTPKKWTKKEETKKEENEEFKENTLVRANFKGEILKEEIAPSNEIVKNFGRKFSFD